MLAGHLGRTVAELQQSMGAREFYGWLAFDRIEPLGHRGDRFLLAQLTTIVTNALRGKAQRAYRMDEFIPWWKKAAQTPAAVVKGVRGWIDAMRKAGRAN